MPRRTISEFRAKTIVCAALGLPYRGWEVDAEQSLAQQLPSGEADGNFVVKVDQAVKGRFKKGLVLLSISPSDLEAAINTLRAKNYRWMLVEPMLVHESNQERYLSLVRDRSGLLLYHSASGGINIEDNTHSVQKVNLNDQTNWEELSHQTGLTSNQLSALTAVFERNHFVFMEINPYVVEGSTIHLLDLAVEVDDAATYFVEDWREPDIRSSHMQRTPEEITIAKLAKKSPASFSFDILNPDGSIFLLLSGGGASITIADEVHNQGFGAQLANYGEYSGNPNAEETYIYTSAVLHALLKSSAPKKALFIGGAVANFTDIANTFKGIIRALDECAPQLQQQSVKVFVRRGGPREEEGLKAMKRVLEKHGLLGAVHDATTPLATAVGEVLQEVGS